MLIGELEHSRTRSDALFFGMRIGFRPLTNLEIGFSKTSLFCGEGRPCGFSSFSDMLLDKTDSGYNLSGFDFRSSHHIKNFPFVVYGQIIGEGSSVIALLGYLDLKLGVQSMILINWKVTEFFLKLRQRVVNFMITTIQNFPAPTMILCILMAIDTKE